MPRKNNNHPKITVVQDAQNPNLLHKVASCGEHRVYGTTWDELLERARGCFDGMVLKAVVKFVNAQKFIENSQSTKPIMPESEKKHETVRISLPPKPSHINLDKLKERLQNTSVGYPQYQKVLHESIELRAHAAVLEKKKKDNEAAIDNLTTEIWDLTDKVSQSQLRIDHLELTSDGYREQVERLTKDLSEANSRLQSASAEANRVTESNCKRKIAELTEKYNTAESNRKYACEHVYQQNEFIREAKTLVADMKTELARLTEENTKLTSEKVNAEHLATQVLRLQAENVKLMGENGNLTIDNDEFKRQTTRLLQEATKYACTGARMAEQGKVGACGVKCGVCLSCLHALDRATIDALSQQANDAVKSNEQSKEAYQRIELKLKGITIERDDFKAYKEQLSQQLVDMKYYATEKEQDLKSAESLIMSMTNKYEKAKKNWELSITHSTHLATIIDLLRGALKTISFGSIWGHKDLANGALKRVDEYFKQNEMDKPIAWESLNVPVVTGVSKQKNFCNCDEPIKKI